MDNDYYERHDGGKSTGKACKGTLVTGGGLFPSSPLRLRYPKMAKWRVAERPCRMDHCGSIQGPETWLSNSGVLSFAGFNLSRTQDSALARGSQKRAFVRPLRQGKARLEKGCCTEQGAQCTSDYVRSEGSCTLGNGCATFCTPPPPSLTMSSVDGSAYRF